MTILLVEQNANYALDVSSRGYVLETGRVVLEGDSDAAARRPRGPARLPGSVTAMADLRADRRQGALPAVRVAALGRDRRRG